MKINLAFSSCPNDTFIFDALVNNKIDTEGIEFNPIIADIDKLNNWSSSHRYDITKLSYYAFTKCYEKYKLLNSGSALGDGCGPLLIKRPETVLNSNSSIAIPGELTTANLLLKIAYPSFINKTSVLFSEIEELVCSGKFDAGLIIHENRFTFQKKGLVKVEDLGDFWFNKTNLPIPLGGIAVSRNFSEQQQKKIDRLILKSLKFSLKNKESASKYVKAHAQEIDEKVIQSHINLYVNDFSINLGVHGRNAIIKVFEELYLDSNNIFV
ncbi:MAG: menaquinone biosynthesis family protein [Flavobacteriales bacterium]|jgi:1,4-dihydroxy-6-naphthoate synthase